MFTSDVQSIQSNSLQRQTLVVTSEVAIFVDGPWIATSCEMTMTGGETEWGRVCKRVWVAALFSPSLVQCSVIRRYHRLEHLLTPFFSWTLLSGAKRHPQINGQQARVSSKFYRCGFYPYPISYLKIVNKIQ